MTEETVFIHIDPFSGQETRFTERPTRPPTMIVHIRESYEFTVTMDSPLFDEKQREYPKTTPYGTGWAPVETVKRSTTWTRAVRP